MGFQILVQCWGCNTYVIVLHKFKMVLNFEDYGVELQKAWVNVFGRTQIWPVLGTITGHLLLPQTVRGATTVDCPRFRSILPFFRGKVLN